MMLDTLLVNLFQHKILTVLHFSDLLEALLKVSVHHALNKVLHLCKALLHTFSICLNLLVMLVVVLHYLRFQLSQL